MRNQFSLFEGDLVNRGWSSMGVGGRRRRDLAARCLILIVLTWAPLAVLALIGDVGKGPGGENFFKDIAAYMQFILGLPLFIFRTDHANSRVLVSSTSVLGHPGTESQNARRFIQDDDPLSLREPRAVRDQYFQPTGKFVEFTQAEVEQSIPERRTGLMG